MVLPSAVAVNIPSKFNMILLVWLFLLSAKMGSENMVAANDAENDMAIIIHFRSDKRF